MRKVAIVLLLFAGIAGGIYLYDQLALAKKITYKLTGTSVQKISATQVQILVGFTVSNETDLSVHLTSVNLQAYISNVLSGYITNTLDIIVPSHSTAPVQVILTILPQNITSNIINSIEQYSSTKNLDLDLVGTITAKTALLPVKIPVKYSTNAKDLTALYKQNFG